MSTPSDSPRRQQVLVLDPGLKDLRSHHHVINRNLAGRAADAGMGLEVLANHRAVAANFPYSVKSVFRRGIYEDSPALGDAPFAALVADHARDVSRCLTASGPAAVVVHSATAAFLQGLGAALAGADHRVNAVVVQLMFHPLGLATGAVDPGPSTTRYAEAFRRLRAAEHRLGRPLHLSTSCHEFRRVFEGLGAGAVDVHPYALLAEAERMAWTGVRQAVQTASRSNRRQAFLFGGDLKLDKGLAWVAAALPALLAEHHDVDFLMHLGDNRFADPRLDLLRRHVVEMAARWPHLRLVEGHIAPRDWDRMLESADFLLIPYDPNAYRWKTSGIFWEALFKCRPGAVIAVTKGTWMEREAVAAALDVSTVEFGNTAELGAVLRR
ncbi:MAG: hypothetical protein WCR51_14245, partial [Planctomycetia bacterium]